MDLHIGLLPKDPRDSWNICNLRLLQTGPTYPVCEQSQLKRFQPSEHLPSCMHLPEVHWTGMAWQYEPTSRTPRWCAEEDMSTGLSFIWGKDWLGSKIKILTKTRYDLKVGTFCTFVSKLPCVWWAVAFFVQFWTNCLRSLLLLLESGYSSGSFLLACGYLLLPFISASIHLLFLTFISAPRQCLFLTFISAPRQCLFLTFISAMQPTNPFCSWAVQSWEGIWLRSELGDENPVEVEKASV